MTPEQLDRRDREVIRLYMEGRTLAEIGGTFNISAGHVSRIAKQWGVPRRPVGQPPRSDASITKYCEECGAPHRRRLAADGKPEKPKDFARRRFCSKECKYQHIKSANERGHWALPWVVGLRTLLAKTCPACGQLLPASRFQHQERGYYATNCKRCSRAGWVDALGEERRRAVRDSVNAHAKRQNNEMRDGAHRYRQLWTGPELELLERDDLNAVQIAAMIGRTPAAVRIQRHHLRRGDPMKTLVAGVSRSSRRAPTPGGAA